LGPGSYPVLALTTEAWIRELQRKGLSEYSPNAQIEKDQRAPSVSHPTFVALPYKDYICQGLLGCQVPNCVPLVDPLLSYDSSCYRVFKVVKELLWHIYGHFSKNVLRFDCQMIDVIIKSSV